MSGWTSTYLGRVQSRRPHPSSMTSRVSFSPLMRLATRLCYPIVHQTNHTVTLTASFSSLPSPLELSTPTLSYPSITVYDSSDLPSYTSLLWAVLIIVTLMLQLLMVSVAYLWLMVVKTTYLQSIKIEAII